MAFAKAMIINILIFSAIVIGISSWYFDMVGSFVDTSTVEDIGLYNATSQIQETAEDMKEGIEDIEITGALDYFLVVPTIVGLGFSLVKLFLEIPVVMITIISEVANILMLPSWFVALGTALITVLVVLAIISHINKTPS